MDPYPHPAPDRSAECEHGPVLAPRAEAESDAWEQRAPAVSVPAPQVYEPPLSALGPLFRFRLEQIHACRVDFVIDINTRATTRVLGGYYKSRRLVRVYARDRKQGRRPLHEVFDTFLHEVAHHLE